MRVWEAAGVLISELGTPALVADSAAIDRNVATMAAVRPGTALRPHVKAHKCTALAAVQAAAGHTTFTCATPRRSIGMAAAGLGDDLLLANETVDPQRLQAMARLDAPVTVAVDSEATIAAAAAAGIGRCLIDVNVGLPRCGVAPDEAGRLADRARQAGLEVRGVMGYEGHLMMVADRDRAPRPGRRGDGAARAGARRRRRRHRLSAAAPARYDLARRHRRHRGPGRQLRVDGHPLRDARAAVRAGAVRRRHRDLGRRRLRGRRRRPQGARHGPRQPVDRGRRGVVLQRRARHVHT